MNQEDAFIKNNVKRKISYDFNKIYQDLKLEICQIWDEYGLKDGPELKQAIQSGKIQKSEINKKVEKIVKRKFAEIFDIDNLDDISRAVNKDKIKFIEFYGLLNGLTSMLKAILEKHRNVDTKNEKHSIKLMSSV